MDLLSVLLNVFLNGNYTSNFVALKWQNLQFFKIFIWRFIILRLLKLNISYGIILYYLGQNAARSHASLSIAGSVSKDYQTNFLVSILLILTFPLHFMLSWWELFLAIEIIFTNKALLNFFNWLRIICMRSLYHIQFT